MLPPEPDILKAREPFIDAQAALVRPGALLGTFRVGWYGVMVNDDRGSFAVVDPNGPLRDLVGDCAVIAYQGRQVGVYVFGSLVLDGPGVAFDIALARRAFLAVARLSLPSVRAQVHRA